MPLVTPTLAEPLAPSKSGNDTDGAPAFFATPAGKPAMVSDLADFHEQIDDIGKSTNEYIWRHHKLKYIGAWVGSIGFALAAYVLIFTHTSALTDSSGTFNARALVFPVLPLFWPAAVYGYYKSKLEGIFWQQVATTLGFTYAVTAPLDSILGRGLTSSSSLSITHVLSGQYDGKPVRIFKYGRLIQEGKHSYMSYETVFEFDTGTKLKDIVVRPLHDPGKSEAVVLSAVPTGYSKLPLEGDFNTDFEVYIPNGDQVEAMQLLQPNVMAELMDTYKNFGLEFIGTKFYIYPLQLVTNKNALLSLLSLAEQLYTRILPTFTEMATTQAA